MAGKPTPLRILRDAVFMLLAVYLAVRAVLMCGWYGIGWDAHAYYVAWSGGLYEALPTSVDAYNYSPLFAQVVWPLTQLPWPVFCAVFVGAAALGIGWLVRPLPLLLQVGVWLACLPEILSGNVFWLLAVMAVLGLVKPGSADSRRRERHQTGAMARRGREGSLVALLSVRNVASVPAWWRAAGGNRRIQATGSPWCVAAFTKVLPCLGPVWFLVRGQWRPLAGFAATALALLAVSVLVSPGEWAAWVDFLRDSAGDSSGKVYLSPVAVTFPLLVRLPLALVVVVLAARTNRPWWLPVAMVLASPVVGWGTFALLAAIPRLRRAARREAGAGQPTATPEARSLTP
jgi:hypothetical protein